MAACNMDTGRHANAALVRESVQEGQYRPVTVKVTMRHAAATETATERRERHAEATGTRRSLWK